MSQKSLIDALQEFDDSTCHKNERTNLAAPGKDPESTTKQRTRPLIIFKQPPIQKEVQSSLKIDSIENSQITRRPLRGNATGLLMSPAVIQFENASKDLNGGVIRNVVLPAMVFNSTRNNQSPSVIKRIDKIVKIDFIQSNSNANSDDGGKQNICSQCRALIDGTICNHCGASLPSPTKRFKQDGVINPFVTITKLPTTVASPPSMKKAAQRRYSPLQITRVNERLIPLAPKNSIKRCMSKDPPECYTLSSDEEEDFAVANTSLDFLEEKRKLLAAELVSNDNEAQTFSENDTIKPENNTVIEPVLRDTKYTLECRSVRIGSYKCKNVIVEITEKHFSVKIESLDKENTLVQLNIAYLDIAQIQGHFGSSLPILAFKTSKSCASAIRNRLQMSQNNDSYYDPESQVEWQRRIIMLPNKISDTIKISLKQYFKQKDTECKNVQRPTMIEITQKMANDILMKSVPNEVREKVTNHVMNYTKKANASNQTSNVHKITSNDADGLAMYPLPPLQEGISITVGDYNCLNPEACLNDAIIDFYLKFIFYEKLTEGDRTRTHIFNSFFYGKLANSRAAKARLNSQQSSTSPAVPKKGLQSWTKHVDIFEKDFIIIPINQKNHWFLAIICYPVLAGDVNLLSLFQDKTPEDSIDTSLPPIDPLRLVNYDDSCSSEETVKLNHEINEDNAFNGRDETLDETLPSNLTKPPTNARKKIPCILIFDSLHPRNWSNVAANLREYLNMEWKAKRCTEKIFDKNTIKGAYPVVPQQSNYMDCGIYLLQYVENFFKDPITDFNLPIRGLQNWFNEDVISKKRKDIQDLILRLSAEQSLNKSEENTVKCSESIKISSSDCDMKKINPLPTDSVEEKMDTSEPLSDEIATQTLKTQLLTSSPIL